MIRSLFSSVFAIVAMLVIFTPSCARTSTTEAASSNVKGSMTIDGKTSELTFEARNVEGETPAATPAGVDPAAASVACKATGCVSHGPPNERLQPSRRNRCSSVSQWARASPLNLVVGPEGMNNCSPEIGLLAAPG